ncbi:MAG: hypothetical protein RLZZ30_1090 [Bacteroidota bacterium]
MLRTNTNAVKVIGMQKKQRAFHATYLPFHTDLIIGFFQRLFPSRI